MFLKIAITFLISTICVVNSANILAIFHFPSPSHYILGSTLLKALNGKGHNVTMISPYPLKDSVENYTDIEVSGLDEFKEEMLNKMVLKPLNGFQRFLLMPQMMHVMNDVNEGLLKHSLLQDLLASDTKFDLVILELMGNDAYLGISHHFNAPTILMSTIGSSPMSNVYTQNPTPYSYVSNPMLSFPEEMNFLQRVANTGIGIFWEVMHHLFMLPAQDVLLKKYFPTAPPLEVLRQNVSLVFLNSHYSVESPRPYVPSMIPIGGFHVQAPKELKGDLKNFLDNATEGFIFFSLGSNVKSSDMPKAKLDAFINTFKKLPYKVLWKFEIENLPNKPENVQIGKWLPQRDILAHPNIKAFITHGGLLSTMESVYHGVPIIGIPVFGDQQANVANSVSSGYAIEVDFHSITKSKLTDALNELLTNPKYKNNVQKRSALLRDQPLKPLDSAIFWVEHVLKNKGAKHLQTAALKLTWYQYYLLDVAAFLISIIIVTLKMIKFVVKKSYNFIKSKIYNQKLKVQ